MKQRMLFRLLRRSFLVRPVRTAVALVAVTVGAAIATATLNLFLDVQAKLHGQFRPYGANLVIAARAGQNLPADALITLDHALPRSAIAVPFAFAVANDGSGNPVVVAGTDMERVRKLNSWWSVSDWPQNSGEVLIGKRLKQAPFHDLELIYNQRNISLHPVGILQTGSEEDGRIYMRLQDFVGWTGANPTVIEIFLPGSSDEVLAVSNQLSKMFPQADVRPVRQIVEAEGRIFEKTRATILAIAVAIVLIAILCLLATLVASVLDRRRDFALMKALGATQNVTVMLFASEAAVLGLLGGMIGCALGLGIAWLIERDSLNAALTPQWPLFPAILLGSIVLSLIAAVFPLRMLRRFEPAAVLKGE